MIKKENLKPAMTVSELGMDDQLMVGSVQTTGLGDENLTLDGYGDIDIAMGRCSVWGDEEW